jgi:predicted DNA-binding protein
MPALKNQKHEAFAQAVALGMPQGQAYMEHVSPSGCTENNAYVRASELCREGSKTAVRIAELRKEVGKAADKKFGLTKDAWLERLERIASAAEDAEDYSAATGALRELGKATSYYDPERFTLEVEVKLGGNAESHGDH